MRDVGTWELQRKEYVYLISTQEIKINLNLIKVKK